MFFRNKLAFHRMAHELFLPSICRRSMRVKPYFPLKSKVYVSFLLSSSASKAFPSGLKCFHALSQVAHPQLPVHLMRKVSGKDGFLVKVIRNPDDEEGRFVILTAHNEQELFYSVVSFFDDYLMEHPHYGGANPMPDTSFNRPLDEYSYSEVPQFKTRSIFTWGHSINDYRQYIDNMARLKFNELIIWNTYIPINIDDIIDYAHSYGIKVVLGYSWGWREIGQAKEIKDEDIENVKKIARRIATLRLFCDEDDKLTYKSLHSKGQYARFIEEVERRIDKFSPKVSQEIRTTVQLTYQKCFEGMVDAVESGDHKAIEELTDAIDRFMK